MKSGIILDCYEMFDHACAFAHCGELCRRKMDGVASVFYANPVIVNYSFSCEVFLKTLLHLYGVEFKNEHELKKLYMLLPEKVQKEIKNSTIKKHGQWEDIWKIPLLDQISDAFVKWRYSYEHDPSKSASISLNFDFLCTFCEILREECCMSIFRITWDEYKKGRTEWQD